MSREIKFRAWDKENKVMHYFDKMRLMDNGVFFENSNFNLGAGHNDDGAAEVMEFTGLKDKNGLTKLYEGDIIDIHGILKGNIYENSSLIQESTNLIIEGLCTEKWKDTEQKALGRGCKYA